ncbi:hypothetical protein L873DRAFT_1081234 [Choiromyces venosus 120613-1]|uniref:Uncharacterized protein n=1 Tax=Choiromyces venosus 120613-1 TaxID=1336337 RepID=A0A3N4JI59_9PEZI|nr:hypothetical protein L873DRAFT_1081234 [Choiromyces venosus 120613-1]
MEKYSDTNNIKSNLTDTFFSILPVSFITYKHLSIFSIILDLSVPLSVPLSKVTYFSPNSHSCLQTPTLICTFHKVKQRNSNFLDHH